MSEYNIQMNKYNALNAEYDQLYPQPMKHANTHAKDGDDPITPSMIGTYTQTQIDTALQNNDPRNWGLGTNGKVINDWNTDASACGFYTGSTNSPDGYRWFGFTVGFQNLFIQKVWRENLSTTLKAERRFYVSSGFSPWEWVNPPMELGVEYRTTERYLGKPVYVKMIEAGFNPAGTVKTTSDKTVSASGLVRFSAVCGAWAFPSLMYGGNYGDDGDIQISVQATSDGIYVFTWSKTRDMTSAKVNVSVYYTKG